MEQDSNHLGEKVEERKSFFKPVWEDPLKKREQFSISLRKQKKQEVLKNKRMKISMSLQLLTDQRKNEAPQQDVISDRDVEALRQLKDDMPGGAESQDWTTKIDLVIETLMAKVYKKCTTDGDKEIIQKVFKNKTPLEDQEFPVIELPDDYLSKTASFLKWLRHNQSDEKQLPDLILSTSIINFSKVNFNLLKTQTDGKNVAALKIELTWLLTQFAYTTDPQVILLICQNLVIESNKLIDIVNFNNFYASPQNQVIVENLLWFWANVIGDCGAIQDRKVTVLGKQISIYELVLEHTQILQVIHNIIYMKKEQQQKLKGLDLNNLMSTICWCLQNMTLKENRMSSMQNFQTYFQQIIRMMNHVCTQIYKIETCPDQVLNKVAHVVNNLIKLTNDAGDDPQQIAFVLDNFDTRNFIERLLTHFDNSEPSFTVANLQSGVEIFGQIFQNSDKDVTLKAVKLLCPDIVDIIDHNILSVNNDVFDQELSRSALSERIQLYKLSLWTLSNLAVSQKLNQDSDEPIVGKDLYQKVLQIAITSRDYFLEESSLSDFKVCYHTIFVEAMFVIASLLTNTEDEHVFRTYIGDKVVIELILDGINTEKGLNLPSNAVFRCLHALEYALNFDIFEPRVASDTSDLEMMKESTYEIKAYCLHLNLDNILNLLLADDNEHVNELAVQILQNYVEEQDDQMDLGNHLENERTNGQHLYDDTQGQHAAFDI